VNDNRQHDRLVQRSRCRFHPCPDAHGACSNATRPLSPSRHGSRRLRDNAIHARRDGDGGPDAAAAARKGPRARGRRSTKTSCAHRIQQNRGVHERGEARGATRRDPTPAARALRRSGLVLLHWARPRSKSRERPPVSSTYPNRSVRALFSLSVLSLSPSPPLVCVALRLTVYIRSRNVS